MTDELRQAAQAALNALESTGENDGYAGVTQFYDSKLVDAAEKALREALAEQPAGEYPPLPDLGAGIYRHPTLGDLYDRLQVEQRMVAYADRVKQAAPQPEAQAAPAVPTVDQVEDEVSMEHGAWDLIDPKELIAAVLRLSAPQPEAAVDERAAFEAWALANRLGERIEQMGFRFHDAGDGYPAWLAWQGRAAWASQGFV